MSDPTLFGTKQRIVQIVANHSGGMAEITDATTLDDLMFDSLDCIDLELKMQDEFDLPTMWPEIDWTPSKTVGSIVSDTLKAIGERHAGR